MIGARLKQARLLAGMTQRELAGRLRESNYRVTPAAISKYEKGKSVPPAQFLLLASSELDVLTTYFSHQPAMAVKWKSFRRHSTLGKRQQEAIKGQAADLAELHVELFTTLYPHRAPALPSALPVETFSDAEMVANDLRDVWELDCRPLDNLVQTFEDRGIVVISWDKSDQFDGLSGWCGDFPVTVINSARSADRTRFNLGHEIGHLLMDTSSASPKLEEKLAHRFAAALLVPEQQARDELGSQRDHIDWVELRMLKRKYGLSMAAWLTRARDLNIITENRYQAMYKEFSWRGWSKEEPEMYHGDEEPIQLRQMASRAVAEGLISPDRVTRVDPDLLATEAAEEQPSEYPDAEALLEMDDDIREMWMAKMSDLAETMEFEIFEAFDEEEFETWE